MIQHNLAIAGEAIPVSRGERLRVLTYKTGNTATVIIRVTQLRGDGEIVRTVERINPNGSDLQTITIIVLTDGYLLSVDAYTSDELDAVGRIFVNVFLQYGDVFSFDTAFPLVSGYIGQLGAIRWPTDRPHNVNEGTFDIDGVSVPAPAAGNDIVFLDQEYFAGRITALKTTISASGNVANRLINATFMTRQTAKMRVWARTTIVADDVKFIYLWNGPNLPADAQDDIYLPIPDIGIVPGYGVTISADNFQGSDAWGDTSIDVQRHFTII